jgi:hypothetical protein
MTGSGVERMTRTAHPLPAPPTGVSTPLPPSNQEAERRSGSRARRTGLRWGLRVLAVGGLAGAAWLLTGSAAQAADRADGPDGSSLLGSLMGADATSPVSDLLQAAVQPLESIESAHHRHSLVSDILDVPRWAPARFEADDDVEYEPSWTTVDVTPDVDEVWDEVAAPHRLTGEAAPEPSRLTPVTSTVAEVELPAEQELPGEPEPAPLPQEAELTAEPSRAPIHQAQPVPVTGRPAAAPVKHGQVSSAHRRHHHTAHAVAALAEEPEESTPGGDTPAAPLRLHLGEVSGTPAGGPGTPTEGGSAAFLPAAIADRTMARHVPAIAPDVEARRHDAEAPTVSPD